MYKEIEKNKRKSILLIVIFIIFVLLIGFLFGEYTGNRYGGLILAAIISLSMTLFSFFKGDSVALASSGAKQIEKSQNPYVYNMLENLCISAGMKMPKLYIIDDIAINAFATGRDPEHASIAVTNGAILKLENEELEGVLAHELSHVKNFDIRLMTIIIVLVGLISLLSHWFLRMQLFGGRDNRDSGAGVAIIIGLILSILSPLIAELIQLAVSRKREFLADATGALLTRYPEGLARALEKISAENKQMQSANHATAHLFISNPFRNTKGFMSNMFSTHPPVSARVKALREMA